MTADSVWSGLAATFVATFVRESSWAYPLLEIAHMVGLGLLFGGILVFDLRLLGLARNISLAALSRHVLRLVFVGIAINIASGLAMFASDAPEFAANASFKAKLVLIALALLNAALYQFGPGRRADAFDRNEMPPPRVRLQAALSIGLWFGVIAAGRLMAYVK